MPTSGPLFETVWHWLLAYGIALARPMALVSLDPIFTRAQIGGLLRGAVATALALPMVPRLVAELAPALQNPVALLLLSVKEAGIGAALGVLLGVPFWALDVAGDVLDAQRGATQGRLNDPAGFEDVSIAGTLLMTTGIALFVLTGGLEMLADLLYGSWRIWPALSALPSLDAQTPVLLLGILDRITRQGLLLAVPPVIALSLQATMEQPSCGLGCAGPLLRGLLKPLLIVSALCFLVIGGLDIGLQRWLFLRDMRMTKSEQKREQKEMEGDPLIKRQHRREQQAGLQAASGPACGMRHSPYGRRSSCRRSASPGRTRWCRSWWRGAPTRVRCCCWTRHGRPASPSCWTPERPGSSER